MPPLRCVVLTLILLASGCGFPSDGTNPGEDPEPEPGATTRILFIGNSLTYANDLPWMVEALADSLGIEGVQAEQVAKPDYALEDHWNDGQAARVIQKGGWHWVVLQQGPSAVLANRANLRAYVAAFAPVIRGKGGEPALYQIWPQLVNFADFDASAESYRLAAEDVDGLFLQAGNAWRAAWEVEPQLALYAPDGLHPSVEGSYLAALTIFGAIFHRSVVGAPRGLRVPGGTFQVSAQRALLFQQAAEEVNASLIP